MKFRRLREKAMTACLGAFFSALLPYVERL